MDIVGRSARNRRGRGHVARRMVNVNDMRGRSEQFSHSEHAMWCTALEGMRALSIHFPEEFERVCDHRATLDSVANCAHVFAERIETLVHLHCDFSTSLEEYDDDWDEDDNDWDEANGLEQEREEWLQTSSSGLHRHLKIISDWMDNPGLMVFGIPKDPTELDRTLHTLAMACWWPFRTLLFPYASMQAHILDTFVGVPEAIHTVLTQLPAIPSVQQLRLCVELNRRPVLGIPNFGEVLLYMIGCTNNTYADLSMVELQQNGGWDDSLDWNDPLKIDVHDVRAWQDQAMAWSETMVELQTVLERNNTLVIDLVMEIYGAAAVVQATAMSDHGRTLLEMLDDVEATMAASHSTVMPVL